MTISGLLVPLKDRSTAKRTRVANDIGPVLIVSEPSAFMMGGGAGALGGLWISSTLPINTALVAPATNLEVGSGAIQLHAKATVGNAITDARTVSVAANRAAILRGILI
jgi:hypothetical protein